MNLNEADIKTTPVRTVSVPKAPPVPPLGKHKPPMRRAPDKSTDNAKTSAPYTVPTGKINKIPAKPAMDMTKPGGKSTKGSSADSSFIMCLLQTMELSNQSGAGGPSLDGAIELCMRCKGGADKCAGKAHAVGATDVTAGFQPEFSKVLIEMGQNSYEERMIAIRTAVQNTQHLFEADGDTVTALPVATFEHHVVILNSNLQVYRAALNWGDDGVNLSEVVKYDLTLIEKDAFTVAQETVSEGVREVFEAAAGGGIRALQTLARTSPADLLRMKVETYRRQIEADRVWRTFVENNRDKVRRQLKDLYPREKMKVQFSDLYSGKYSDEELPQFSGRVAEGLDTITNHLDRFLEAVANGSNQTEAAVGQSRFRSIESDIEIGRFREIVEDFTDYVGVLRNIIEQVRRDNCVACMGFVSDSIGKHVQKMSIASAVIEHVFKSIRQQA